MVFVNDKIGNNNYKMARGLRIPFQVVLHNMNFSNYLHFYLSGVIKITTTTSLQPDRW